jgi:hypothetical protein
MYIALQFCIVLMAIAGTLLLFSGVIYVIGWLVGLGLRGVPLAGPRRRGP